MKIYIFTAEVQESHVIFEIAKYKPIACKMFSDKKLLVFTKLYTVQTIPALHLKQNRLSVCSEALLLAEFWVQSTEYL